MTRYWQDFDCGNNFLFGGIRPFFTAISSTAILHFINGWLEHYRNNFLILHCIYCFIINIKFNTKAMPRIDNDTVTFLQTNINADSKVSHLPDIFPSAQTDVRLCGPMLWWIWMVTTAWGPGLYGPWFWTETHTHHHTTSQNYLQSWMSENYIKPKFKSEDIHEVSLRLNMN